jgi:ATP-dependent DNA ligase
MKIDVHIMHPVELFSKSNLMQRILNNQWAYEPKIDGVRCIAWRTNTKLQMHILEMYSRNSRRLENIEPLFDRILNIPDGFAFDGELFYKTFNMTMSIVMNHDVKITPFYYVFDMVPISTILKGQVYKIPYEKRKDDLKKVMYTKNKSPIEYVNYFKEEFESALQVEELIDSYVKRNYEGVVFKLLDSPYVPTRSAYWIKGKKINTLDLLVVKVIKSKEHLGQIQAIVCRLSKKGNIVQPVGSGLTNLQRTEWYKHPEEIIGKIVEVKFHEFTADGKLRQPTFIRIRNDKTVPDL